MTDLTAVVVEDQPLAREHIVEMLKACDVNVLDACANGRDAVERIPQLSPDVVFLDVQMPELDGFDVIDAIGADAMPPVVFITAHDEYALKAFEVFAAGYLLKPVAAGKLRQLVERVREGKGTRNPAKRGRDLAQLLDEPGARPASDRLVVRSGGRVHFIRHADIEWVEASGNYVLIHAGGRRYLSRQPMQSLERRLASAFARIHRSTLVNLALVQEMRIAPHGEYDVVLRTGQVLRVTRRFRAALEQRLKMLP